MNKPSKPQVAESKLEAGLAQALRAVDNQIKRELQRSPAERDLHGVQKWQPYADRVEQITEFLLVGLGEKKFDLDGLIVLSQALTKSLTILAEDTLSEGLGQMRTNYLKHTFELIESDAHKGRMALTSDGQEQYN